MFIVYDLIALAIVIVFTIVCLHKGFLSVLLGAAKWIAAFVAASLLSGMLAGVFYDSVLADKNEKAVERLLPADTDVISDAAELKDIAEKLGYILPSEDAVNVIDNLKAEREKGVSSAQAISLYIVKPVQMNIIKPIFFAVIAASVFAVGCALQCVFKKTNKIPVVGNINRITGALLGVVFGIITVAFYCSILALVANLTNDRLSWLNSSVLEKTLIKHLINLSLYRRL